MSRSPGIEDEKFFKAKSALEPRLSVFETVVLTDSSKSSVRSTKKIGKAFYESWSAK